MELIILLIGELLVAVFMLAASIATAVVGLFADLLVAIFGPKFSSRFRVNSAPLQVADSDPKPKAPLISKKFLRVTAWICGGFLALVFATIGILQVFFFKPAATALLSGLGQKNGATIEFSDIRGNLFTGELAVEQLKVAADGTSWKAEVGAAELNINMLRVLGRRTWLDSLDVRNATVELDAGEPPSFDPAAGLKRILPTRERKKRYREKRRFGIAETRLENLTLIWNRPGGTRTFEVDHFDCENLKSEYAVFQVLFRSTANGRVNGLPWKIRCDKTGERARRTEWQFEAIPLEMVAEMVGGPFQLFEGGTLDVSVIDEWSLDDAGPEVDLDWHFVFRDFTAGVPPRLSDSKTTNAIVAFVNRAEDPLDLQFTLTWNKEQLRGSASLDTRGLVMAITRALLPDEMVEDVKNKAKDLWNEIREKKKAPETEERSQGADASGNSGRTSGNE